ncbi:Polyketide cyclase / dehydrase and lipid transport [Teratosphaeria destructans]|uniref:Polyketide cyclase / dehydrase and lipid transport n=1 Tax=Teratosphaeria destructans TaxID=418781 RepID=A0A9W7SKC7_9PEZI|nr:Polyketide cyclase / dehydrase and lipid transport [Teratosphaeria destructans]
MQSLRPSLTSLLQQSARTTCRHSSLHGLHRTFVSNPFSGPQTLTASRTLQHPSKLIYSIISDVASYSHFLPYCQNSKVTKYSSPHPIDSKQYPEEATLTIGFTPDVSDTYTSRVYCVPYETVEAVSGLTNTTLPAADIAHHSPRPTDAEEDPARKHTVLTHLLTRWTLRPYPYKPPPLGALHPETTHKNHEETSELPGQEKTEVNLTIEYQFANPMYAALSTAASATVADKMIQAFETRVRSVVEGPGHAQGLGRKDGFRKKR